MELSEIIKTYAEVPLKFSSYYKYSFTYRGTAPDGAEIAATYGGDSNDIYRHTVKADDIAKIGDTPANDWHFLHVVKDGADIFSNSLD